MYNIIMQKKYCMSTEFQVGENTNTQGDWGGILVMEGKCNMEGREEPLVRRLPWKSHGKF